MGIGVLTRVIATRFDKSPLVPWVRVDGATSAMGKGGWGYNSIHLYNLIGWAEKLYVVKHDDIK